MNVLPLKFVRGDLVFQDPNFNKAGINKDQVLELFIKTFIWIIFFHKKIFGKNAYPLGGVCSSYVK